MKNISVLAVLCLFVGGCAALQDPSQRKSSITDFAHPDANSAYYEFSSSPLDRPSVLDDQPAMEQPAYDLGDDEDFTAEKYRKLLRYVRGRGDYGSLT